MKKLLGILLFISIALSAWTDRPEASGRILSNLLKLAVPITLGSAATSLVTLIDTKLVMSQLTDIFHRVDGLVLNADGTGAALDAARGIPFPTARSALCKILLVRLENDASSLLFPVVVPIPFARSQKFS